MHRAYGSKNLFLEDGFKEFIIIMVPDGIRDHGEIEVGNTELGVAQRCLKWE